MEPRISSAKAPFIHFGFCLHLLFAIKGNLCHLWIPRAFGFGDTCLISLPCLQYRQTYGSTTLQYMILLNDSLWSADNHLSQTQHHQGGTFAGGEAGQAAGGSPLGRLGGGGQHQPTSSGHPASNPLAWGLDQHVQRQAQAWLQGHCSTAHPCWR